MVDLKELERRLNEALAKETKDSLNTWIDSHRGNKHTGTGSDTNKHGSMVGLNDTYRGLVKKSTNQMQNPTPPIKAFFLPVINKKVNH